MPAIYGPSSDPQKVQSLEDQVKPRRISEGLEVEVSGDKRYSAVDTALSAADEGSSGSLSNSVRTAVAITTWRSPRALVSISTSSPLLPSRNAIHAAAQGKGSLFAFAGGSQGRKCA